jgi:tetratricopeptide (TPR) repeat protein
MDELLKNYQEMLRLNTLNPSVYLGNNDSDRNYRKTREEYLTHHRNTVLQQELYTNKDYSQISIKGAHNYGVKLDKTNTDINTLKMITVKDLKLNHTHKGKYMILRIIDKPIIMTSAMLLLEDQDKEILNCAVYNLNLSRNDIINKFTVDKYVVIFEPFYKIYNDGWDGLRMENPQEIMVFNTKDEALNFTNKGKEDVNELKDEGNKFMLEGNYTAAMSKYKQALTLDLKNHILYSNLAEAYLKLEQNTLALKAINKSLDLDPNYTKSLFRKVRALYALNKFEEAISCCNKLLELKDIPKEEIKMIKAKSEIKLNNTKGIYDVYQMYMDAQKDFYIDYGDYTSPKVAYCHTKENGIYVTAKEKIKQGELISAHKALACLKKDKDVDIFQRDSKHLYLIFVQIMRK